MLAGAGPGAGPVSQSAMCQSHKHEDLNSDPKKPSMVAHAGIFSVGRVETRRSSGPAGQASPAYSMCSRPMRGQVLWMVPRE